MGPPVTAYLGARGFTQDLLWELQDAGAEVQSVTDRLVIATGKPVRANWAQNTWRNCVTQRIGSVGEAVRFLRGIQRNWVKYSIRCHRRAELIQARLPPLSRRPLRFLEPIPTAPMGSWTLLGPGTLLAAGDCSSPYPHGEVEFEEDREGPPSRAYLKLWELFTTQGVRPQPGERCLDLGSSPGGWTWVLANLGCQVVSVDKAPLDRRASGMAGVTQIPESAFALDPLEVGPVDWLFCDVVCYPRRLLGLVKRWLASGLCSNLVCTVKFQGATDHDVCREYASIPGSNMVHLWHNRHELTWMRLDGDRMARGA